MKNKEYIASCKKIVEQEGSCAYVSCFKCPFKDGNSCLMLKTRSHSSKLKTKEAAQRYIEEC
jgi:hypothetical protein